MCSVVMRQGYGEGKNDISGSVARLTCCLGFRWLSQYVSSCFEIISVLFLIPLLQI